jgi:hypothetical protein
MKKFTVITLFSFFIIHTISQEFVTSPPNYNEIKKNIKNPESNYYYPKLFKRYNNADSTLTLNECRALYYGYLYNDNYTENSQYSLNDSISEVLFKDTVNEVDMRRVVEHVIVILKENPFNIGDINLLTNLYLELNDTKFAKVQMSKFNIIINSILSTGDGRTKKSAMHVISERHKYDILNILGLEFGSSQRKTGDKLDYLEVKPNRYHIDGLYFNIEGQ